jgi:hypothetical protein
MVHDSDPPLPEDVAQTARNRALAEEVKKGKDTRKKKRDDRAKRKEEREKCRKLQWTAGEEEEESSLDDDDDDRVILTNVKYNSLLPFVLPFLLTVVVQQVFIPILVTYRNSSLLLTGISEGAAVLNLH